MAKHPEPSSGLVVCPGGMPAIRFRRRLRKRGRGYVIPLTRREVERLQADERTLLDIKLSVDDVRFDNERFGRACWAPDASERHTELAADAADVGG